MNISVLLAHRVPPATAVNANDVFSSYYTDFSKKNLLANSSLTNYKFHCVKTYVASLSCKLEVR